MPEKPDLEDEMLTIDEANPEDHQVARVSEVVPASNTQATQPEGTVPAPEPTPAKDPTPVKAVTEAIGKGMLISKNICAKTWFFKLRP